MQRENIGNLVRRGRSPATSARFLGLVETLVRAGEPTPTQLEAIESCYQSTGAFLASAPEFSGILREIHGHGSRQLGTLVRPRDMTREGFDVDQIARFERSALERYGGDGGPSRLLGDLYTVLGRYADRHGLKLVRWERCVTLEYSGGMTADIAPFVDGPDPALAYGDTHGMIPDRKLRQYEATNPLGYNSFFNLAASTPVVFTAALRFKEEYSAFAAADVTPLPSADEVFTRLLCRLIQLLKLHRNVAFGSDAGTSDAAPTSVFLTTIAAKAYVAQAPQPHEGPLDLLLDVVKSMLDQFVRVPLGADSEFWYLQNPSAPTDNLACGMNERLRQQGFIWWHRQVVGHIEMVLDAIERQSGIDVLLPLVKEAFGERAAKALHADQSHRRVTDRALGKALLIPAIGAPLQAVARPHTFYGNV